MLMLLSMPTLLGFQHAYSMYHAGYHHGGGFGDMILRGIIYSVISHMIGGIFHGHGLLGTIVMGIVILFVVNWVWRRFF